MRKLIAFLALLSLFLITSAQLYAQQSRSRINSALAQAATAEATSEATAEATAASTPTPTGVPAARPDLVDTLKADPAGRYKTLIAAIESDNVVASVLNGAGPFTLLAPTDDAFTALEKQTGLTQDQLLADQATLTKILLYHIVPGQHFFRNLTSGPTLPTELLGQSVTFNLDSGVFTVQGQNISDADTLAGNGVIDTLDGVMLPPDVAAALATPEVTAAPSEEVTVAAPVATEEMTAMATPIATAAATEMSAAAPMQAAKTTALSTEAVTEEATAESTPTPTGVPAERPNIIDTLKADTSGRYTTLVAAIDADPVVASILKGAGPFTLLAPTDDAFAALEKQTGLTQDQLLADQATLTKILLYHIVPGQHFFRNLTSGPTLPTELLGQSVTFNLDSGVFTVQGQNISDADTLAGNGVIDTLDGVMLPPDVAAALATPEVTAAPSEEVTVAAPVATEAVTAMVTEMSTIAPPLATPEATVAPMATEAATAVATAESTAAPTAEATAAATPIAGVPAERPNIIDTLKADTSGRYTTLVAAIDADPVVASILKGAGPFTLLAPTDDAFAALEKQTGLTQDQLLADQATLTKILLYHIVPGQHFFRNLTSGPTLPTELLGQSVTFNLDSGVFTVQGQNISDADTLAGNGVIDTLDGVMLPPDVAAALATPEVTAAPSEEVTVAAPVATEAVTAAVTEMSTVAPPVSTPEITATAAPISTPEATAAPTAAPTAEATAEATAVATQEAGAPAARSNIIDTLKADPAGRYTTLIAALDAAGLTNTLSSGGPFTLLAPTNDAFTALEKQTGETQDQLLADKQTLSEILSYHVVLGQHFFRTLTSGPTLPTLLQGQSVTFNLNNGAFTVQGQNISDADTLAGNGVIDTLDSVMLPPDVAAALATPEVTAAATAAPTEEITAAPTEEVTPEATAAPTEAVTPEATPEATEAPTAPLAANSPHIRFVNLSTDAGSVDISLSGSISQNHLGFGMVTSWMTVAADTYQINVTKSDGGATIGTLSADLALGDYDTVAITGSSADNTLLVNVLHENYDKLATGKARLSVFNGVHGSSSYNVVLSGRTIIVMLGYPGTQGANDGFYNIDVTQGTYDVRFVLNRDGTTVIDLPNMKLEAGFNYFIAAAGASAQPGAVTSVSGVPAQ